MNGRVDVPVFVDDGDGFYGISGHVAPARLLRAIVDHSDLSVWDVLDEYRLVSDSWVDAFRLYCADVSLYWWRPEPLPDDATPCAVSIPRPCGGFDVWYAPCDESTTGATAATFWVSER